MAKKIDGKKPFYDINWYADKYQSLVVWRNWFVFITFLSIIGILFMTFAAFYIVPLKSVSPFVIQIDERSGVTEVVQGSSVQEYSANEALIKHFAVNYMMARENFSLSAFQTNYETVRIMSSKDAMRGYAADMDTNNPNSPVNLYGTHTERFITLKSFNFQEKTKNVTSVIARFSVKEVSENRYPKEYFISILMTCEFKDMKIDDQDRVINPLGFQVTYYRANKET